MYTVALIGPDGSGKSTISKRLLQDDDLRIERIYMGINRDESNYVLPTTWLVTRLRKLLKQETNQGGPRDDSKAPSRSKNPLKRLLKEVKSGFVLLNRIAEEWYRQVIAWYFVRRGIIVLFDRHFYADYYHHDVAGGDRRWTSRVHGYMLQHLYPKPDLTLYLDAPADVLYQRKGEGTVDLLEQRRQIYLSLRDQLPNFVVIDTTQPLDTVIDIIKTRLLDFNREDPS